MEKNKTVISIDPGIANTAICVLCEDNRIIDWTLFPSNGTVKDYVRTLDSYMSHLLSIFVSPPPQGFDVVVERQPPWSVKLYKIQTVLETYFACCDSCKINTVKTVSVKERWKKTGVKMPTVYAERKKSSVAICESRLRQENRDRFASFKKKDDLADAYLQAYCEFI